MTDAGRKKILCVGDGDLTLSLALSRAYGEYVDVTGSVLESGRQEFLTVFPEAPLEELCHRNVTVLYGVDATQLHTACASLGKETNENKSEQEETGASKIWDLIAFHHPHLGVSNLEKDSESTRAILHHRLLCHYLHSAKKISKLIHVCLAGTQPTTWGVMEAAKLQNLKLVKKFSDSNPFAKVWTNVDQDHCDISSNPDMDSRYENLPEAAKVEPHFAAPRRYRNGKLGRHFLSRYGYRHRRTEGVLFKGSSKDANVSESMHFVFAELCSSGRQDNKTHDSVGPETLTKERNKAYVCAICEESFDTISELRLHLESPVRIPMVSDAIGSSNVPSGDKQSFRKESEQDLNAKHISSPIVKPSVKTKPEQVHNDNLKIGGITVSVDCDGKRLRWFLQHSKISGFKFTKSLAESTIRAGLVVVNGQAALDSSRILRAQDDVKILRKDAAGEHDPRGNSTIKTTQMGPKRPRIEILKRSSTSSPKWLVAMKPSGMRARGEIPGTLESILSEQVGERYTCISSLETSCSGLCVLAHTNCNETESASQFHDNSIDEKFSILHTLTVLVHGIPTSDDWFSSRTALLASEAKWRQKKRNKKRKLVEERSSEPQEETETKNTIQKFVTAEVMVKESRSLTDGKSSGKSIGLSTLQVVTHETSTSSIRHYFRKEGFPIVGDAFCKQEYLKLKRSIRNRVKNKLCIGCFRVEIKITKQKMEETHVVEVPYPNKLSATFWETFVKEETPTPAL